jgi:hypothetical protein
LFAMIIILTTSLALSISPVSLLSYERVFEMASNY